ncbi:unnamed protein product [Colias eurytheme]|nr:unnamed protein product [Colias eurytheme]
MHGAVILIKITRKLIRNPFVKAHIHVIAEDRSSACQIVEGCGVVKEGTVNRSHRVLWGKERESMRDLDSRYNNGSNAQLAVNYMESSTYIGERNNYTIQSVVSDYGAISKLLNETQFNKMLTTVLWEPAGIV